MQDGNCAVGSDRGLAFGAADIARLTEAIAIRQPAEIVAVGFDFYITRNDDVKAIIDLAFPDDIVTVFVLMPVRCTQNLPDLRM